MALLPLSPDVILLEAGLSALQSNDWADLTGLEDPVTCRHYRQRRSNSVDERPGLALQFLSCAPPEEDTPQISHDEKLMQMDLNLIAEWDVKIESTGDDPTGLEDGNRLLAGGVMALRDRTKAFAPLVHEIVVGLKELDETTQADKGRLTLAVSVLYRVRSDDENVLLSMGV